MWTPDKDRIDALGKEQENLLRTLGEPKDDDEAARLLRLLEIAGELSFLGEAEPNTAGVIAAIDGSRITGALSAIDPELLSDASEKAVVLADELIDVDDGDRATLEDEILGAIGLRTKLERILEGAHAVLGRHPEVPSDLQAALLAFDEVLRPELWRHLPLNEKRSAEILHVSPLHRSRLWWLHRGADLPADALDALGTTARLIHLFPEARQELDRLIAAERELDGLRNSAPRGVVLSLAEHLERRRVRAMRSRSEAQSTDVIRFAAADITSETVICERPEVTLSVTLRSFVVDLERSAASNVESVVQLEVEGRPALAAQPTEMGRFEFPLDAEQLRASRATLRISLAEGSVVIALPLDDD